MQKVGHFWAQIGGETGCELGCFCPEPFNYIIVLFILKEAVYLLMIVT